eukprot:Skav232337  [mRNA]  locus=scaffold1704:302122:313376:+ [translate_table: standard]
MSTALAPASGGLGAAWQGECCLVLAQARLLVAVRILRLLVQCSPLLLNDAASFMRPERRSVIPVAPKEAVNAPSSAPATNLGPVSANQVWICTVVVAVILVFLGIQSLRLLWSRSRAFERDFTLALRSGIVFLLLMLPLTHPEQIALVPSNVQALCDESRIR